MMRLTVLLFLFSAVWLRAVGMNVPAESEAPYRIGEKITYKLFYNWNFVWLAAGEVVFEIKDEGDLYHVEVTGKTYPNYEWFYKVRDKYHSYIDKKTLLPKLYIRDVQQGSYVHYEKIEYDHIHKKMTSYTGRSMKEAKPRVLDMKEQCYDLVSTFYHLRGYNLGLFKLEKKLDFKMVLDNRIYDLGIRLNKQHNKLDVREHGKFRALECTGQVVEGHVFGKNTNLKLYVGDDENKLPLLIESPLSVGSVKAVLVRSENLKYPMHSKL